MATFVPPLGGIASRQAVSPKTKTSLLSRDLNAVMALSNQARIVIVEEPLDAQITTVVMLLLANSSKAPFAIQAMKIAVINNANSHQVEPSAEPVQAFAILKKPAMAP